MAVERYVVLGVAQVRSPWFREVARWATSAMLPVEFIKAMSLEEVRVRVRSGRGYSALLVDDSLPGLDRDLVERAREAGCAVIIVDGGRAQRAWGDLGASGVLPTGFGRDDLLQLLTQVAMPVSRNPDAAVAPAEPISTGFRGQLVAVTGAGGTGRSTMAAAAAQGLAGDRRNVDLVCLADLALDAEQAMLHGATDVVPGVVELVESHRTGAPSIDDVRGLTWRVVDRGYHLLLGLRRHRDWTAIRPRAFAAGLDGLRRGFRVVVADVDADFEGEQATGSMDVEERNAMARTTILCANLVLVVGSPGMKGMHAMLRVTRDVLGHGVPGNRVLPVLNRAPKGPRARAEISAAFAELLASVPEACEVPGPIFVAERKRLDEVQRDGARLPDGWLGPLSGSVQALLDRADTSSETSEPAPAELEPVRPGSIGSWAEEG
jgi:MinD-like ATPase involved in chromosome partitioning or flagellar assembly